MNVELLNYKLSRMTELGSATKHSPIPKITPSSRFLSSQGSFFEPTRSNRDPTEIDTMISSFKDRINSIISAHSYRNSPSREKVSSFRIVSDRKNNIKSEKTESCEKQDSSFELDEVVADMMSAKVNTSLQLANYPRKKVSNKLNFETGEEASDIVIPKLKIPQNDDSVEMNPTRLSRNVAPHDELEKSPFSSLDSKNEIMKLKKEPSLGAYNTAVRRAKQVDNIKKDAANFSAERLEECNKLLSEFEELTESPKQMREESMEINHLPKSTEQKIDFDLSEAENIISDVKESPKKAVKKVKFADKPVVIKYNADNLVKQFEVYNKDGKKMKVVIKEPKPDERRTIMKVDPAEQEKRKALNKLNALIAECEEEEEETECPQKTKISDVSARNLLRIKEIEQKVKDGKEWRVIRKTRSVTPKPRPLCHRFKDNPERFFSKSPPKELIRRLKFDDCCVGHKENMKNQDLEEYVI